ncbi:MAG: LysE family translocator, partial [Pseudomonadota bacterium]
GPNAVNCMSVAARHGLGRAAWAVAGVLLAGLFYMAAVITGLGAVILANEALFSLLKLAGAAYLIWMGIGLLRRKSAPLPMAEARAADGAADSVEDGAAATLRRAVLISLSNPKAMIVYGAVFTQFVGGDAMVSAELAVILPTALAINALVYGGYALMGAAALAPLMLRAQRWVDRAVGGFYILAGLGLALSELQTARAGGRHG